MPVTPDQLVQDKDFMAAHPADQTKYLSTFDRDFASAKPEDQQGYLGYLRQHTPEAAQGRAMAQNPPPAAGPKTLQMHQWGGDPSPTAGLLGSSPNPVSAGPKYTAAVGLPIAAAATVMGGGLPYVGSALKAIPTIAAMEGINYVKRNT